MEGSYRLNIIASANAGFLTQFLPISWSCFFWWIHKQYLQVDMLQEPLLETSIAVICSYTLDPRVVVKHWIGWCCSYHSATRGTNIHEREIHCTDSSWGIILKLSEIGWVVGHTRADHYQTSLRTATLCSGLYCVSGNLLALGEALPADSIVAQIDIELQINTQHYWQDISWNGPSLRSQCK